MMELLQQHWPLVTVAGTLWVLGHFFETSVFTKKRVLENHPEHKVGRTFAQSFHHWFFYWMRESMELHPLMAGVLIGMIWVNPLHVDPPWTWQMSCGYFLGAGFASLFGWILITKGLEKAGWKGSFRMPGESEPPK